MMRLVGWLAAIILASLPGAAFSGALVVEVDELRTAAGPPLTDARVRIQDDRIVAVGPAAQVEAPPGTPVLRARVATPGFIDASTSAGLSGLWNVPAVLDQDEKTDPDQAGLRALDAFDPRDPLLRHLLEHGVTVIQSGPGPANPIAGQAGIFRTHGRSADEMAIRFPSAMVFNLGEVPKSTYREKEGLSTRMGTAARIRERLAAARVYDGPGGLFGGGSDAPDLGLETLREVVEGRIVAIFTAHRADDITTALRIAREFDLDAAVAAATEGYLVREELRSAGIPVFAGPVMERVSSPQTENASYENAALLAAAGIPIAIRSGFEAYVPKNRVLLFEAAVAAAYGLDEEAALLAITRTPAEMLGIADDYGTVEPGKVADLVLFDGDPFEYTTHVSAVVASGEIVHRRD